MMGIILNYFDWDYAPLYVALHVLLINCLAFAAFALDKHFAKKQMWRISEKTLLTMALFGGAMGAIIAQQRLRHKTYKQPFKTFLFVTLVINVISVGLAVWAWKLT